jgi:ankyrin repeat protein
VSATPAEQLVLAIITGETDTVGSLLAAAPDLANQRLPGNDRSMLHYATDWPGHYPDVATSIALLIEAGADPDVAMPPGDSPGVAETPLHWAASSNDVAAVRALLDAGATVDALGGIFGGCTPYVEAVIFEKYGAAQLLLDRGATDWLPGAAALGHADMVAGFFDDDGNLRGDVGRLPHDDIPPTAPVFLDRAFQFACRAGHLDIAKFLLARGADPAAISPANTSAREMAEANEHDATVRWLEEILEAR